MKPSETPIGLLLHQTSKKVGRSFDDALAAAGGSLSVWLILLPLNREGSLSHAELAERVGVKGPTLTHHLDALEERGIIVRERLESNRRTQMSSLTAAGTKLFQRLVKVAQSFDAQLRGKLTEKELSDLRRLLAKIGG